MIEVVVFDIGNVLIEWDPEAHYDRTIGPERRRQLFAEVDLDGMNQKVDLGEDLAATVELLAESHPAWRAEIRDWHRRWLDLIGPEIADSVALLHAVKRQGLPVWALTNFGEQTFNLAARHFPVINDFDGAVVSGRLGVVKPSAEIYEMLENATGAAANRIFFTDDRAENIAAAADRGWNTHHFEGAAGLEAALRRQGLIDPGQAAIA